MKTDADDYLSLELQRLDLLLHREILRMRAAYHLSLDEFRGLYISDEQVDSLVDRDQTAQGLASATVTELTQRADELHKASCAIRPAHSPWARLTAEFGLSQEEQDILLLALAPEIDLKYEALYAYLNNDITRKFPTVELATRVLATSSTERARLRGLLIPQAALFADNLLLTLEPPSQLSSLAQGFSLAQPVARYLLGFGCSFTTAYMFRRNRANFCRQSPIQPASAPGQHRRNGLVLGNAQVPLALTADWDRLALAQEERQRLRNVRALFESKTDGRSPPFLVFEGRHGAGRSKAAGALCAELGLDLFTIDLDAARSASEPLTKVLDAALLQSRLEPAGLYLENMEFMFGGEGKLLPEYHTVAATLAGCRRPIFLACTPGAPWREFLRQRPTLCFRFPDPDYSMRLNLWSDALESHGMPISKDELHALAGRFVLNTGQIEAATVNADYARLLSGDTQAFDVTHLFQAAREQSDASLGSLAVKVDPIHRIEDLVLPATTVARIKDLTGAIHNRHIVYSEWGFARRIATGKGVKALFAGGSGTGKTMTASVIAQELRLDLYKIDLSGVVSKYIGETEKNLDRIFRAAHSSNAILFFDEADALFGKRSEVKDAHDRYANIEVAYLLQKVEDHEGVVILASNLGKNIDNAFSRRLHYIIDFPLPDEHQRERLWRTMFPPEAPLEDDVDFRFLAKQFNLAGGDIKNVALDAAFLAAQDGRIVTMKQLINAMARQMAKQGRMPSAAEFKQYHALITHCE
jgi:hypothetical protein